MNIRARSIWRNSILVSAIAAGLSLGVAHAQRNDRSSAPAAQSGQPAQAASADDKKAQQSRQVLASRLIGMGVRDGQGMDLGEIQDLAIDAKSGQVRYALVEFDSGYLAGDRTVPVPLKEFRLSSNGNSLVQANAKKDQLQKLAVKASDWNGTFLGNEERLAQLDQAWGLPRQAGASLMRGNTVMDKEVQDRSGADIGEIEDLLIDMDRQKVNYAMLEFERSWLKPEKTVAVPFNAFSRTGGEKFVMDVNREKLRDLQGLTPEQRRNPDDPQVAAIVERHIVFFGTDRTAGAKADGGAQPNTRSSGAGPAAGASSSQQNK